MKTYKTSAEQRKAQAQRNAIRRTILGDEGYRAEMREQRARAVEKKRATLSPEEYRAWRRKQSKVGRPREVQKELCKRARVRGRQKGIEATIRHFDLHWPVHCPVLGVELDYATPRGLRDLMGGNMPSLDRWDNSKGYVPGNVFVISMRANSIKSDATADELEAVARYARLGPASFVDDNLSDLL